MAKDALFFRQATVLNKNGSPANSLTMQCIWACLLCFSGTYGQLLNYIMFPTLLFYILTISGLFKLRRTQPQLNRPYKAFGYPFIPAIYIILAALVCIDMLIYQPTQSLWGLVIIAIGIPIYYFFNRAEASLNPEERL
jgi:APA family basic amino acid/polyamine antiporter